MKHILWLGAALSLLIAPAAPAAQTKWMRLHPDVSWKYLAQWEKKHQWLTPAREGRDLFQKGDVAAARRSLENALSQGSDDGRLYYELGYCYQAEGNPSRAIEMYRKAIEKLSRQSPSHLYLFNAHYLLGNLYEQQKQEDEALKQYEEALKLRPKTPVLSYHKAIILRKQGKLDESMTEIRRALAADPSLAPANYVLGLLHLEKDEFSAARGYFEKAAAAGVEEASSYFCLGYIASREGNQDAAVDYYRRALAKDPEHIEANIALGNYYYEQENLPLAQGYFERLARLEPQNARWHYNLGVIYREQDQPDLSEREFQKARAIDPNLLFKKTLPGGLKGLSARAAQLYTEGKLEEAAATYRQAILEDPFYVPARFNLAIVYTALGSNGKALREYGRVIRIEPDWAPAHLNAGILCYRQEKKSPEAAHHFRKYLDLEPQTAQADLIRIYLHEIQGW